MAKFIRFCTAVTCMAIFPVLFPTFAYAMDRIGVRQGANGGEFYDTVTNAKIQFRGNNYYFDPRVQTSADDQNALTQFTKNGYNSIRIFIGYDQVGNSPGRLSPHYMDEFTNFLQEAKTQNLYVFPVFHILPNLGGYYPAGNTLPDPSKPETQDPNINLYFMSQPFIDAKKRYVQDFINELHKRNAPTEDIVGYELENEVLFSLDQPPLSLTGMRQTAAGSFNMSDATQKQTAMAANLVNWSDQVSAAVKQVDPSALTTISFQSPTVYSTSTHYAISAYWIFVDPEKGGSSVDFVDLHMYPAVGSLSKQMTDYQITSNKKPVLMGEFGADKKTYPDLSAAVLLLRDWQIQSCSYNVRGWLAWAWGYSANVTGFWGVDEGSGAINHVLAPIYRADPCKAENTYLSKPGDLNGDGKVDIFDYNILVSNFGKPYTIFDYNTLVGNFGK